MPLQPRPLELRDEEITALPVDALALRVLEHLAPTAPFALGNVLNAWRAAGVDGNSDAMKALVEACDWLSHKGLVANNPEGTPYGGFVTRLGSQVLDRGLSFLGAIERLGSSVHPSIESVRSQFLLGEYELAAFAAIRAVEVRVRELGDYDDADIGYTMMRKAFNPETGPLTDPMAEGGERQGLSDLYAGAFAVFKNPTSHRVVTFEDPAEAAEVVTLASLLLRVLDRRVRDAKPGV